MARYRHLRGIIGSFAKSPQPTLGPTNMLRYDEKVRSAAACAASLPGGVIALRVDVGRKSKEEWSTRPHFAYEPRSKLMASNSGPISSPEQKHR